MAFECIANLTGIGTVQTTEAGGVVRNHSSTYLVTGTAADFGTDEQASLNVLNTIISGLPLPGEEYSLPGQLTSRLFVVGRTCRMEGPLNAVVDVTWQQFETSLNNPDGIGAVHSVGTKTVTTTRDRSGEPILVALGTDETTGAPQQGTITVMDAEPVYTTELVMDVPAGSEPTILSSEWIGRVNSIGWRGLTANSWLCTAATPRPLNPYMAPFGFRRYVYAFKFVGQVWGDGWNPTVEWIDPVTRMPPALLEPGVGRKLIPWYEARDFNQEPVYIPASS
jgi:hypothetical protein